MFETLGSILYQHVKNYLDDMGSHHLSMEEHVQVNRDILQRFRESGLFANTKKCEFHQDTLQFLGVEVSQRGFKMEKMKVDMIEKWKNPQNVWGVCEFVGFCNFYRWFIKSFSEIARPLHDLTKTGQQWQWTEQEQMAFDELK
jgi:hypothetical protein